MWRFVSFILIFISNNVAAFDEKLALQESQAAIGRTLGEYTLRDHEGRAVRLSELRGKPLVVHFIYTGCFQVCPTSTQFLAKAVAEAERTLGEGAFRVATIGFNLPFDTPQSMKDFRRRFGLASPNWLFLTPEAETLPRLAAELGFRYEPTAAGFDHLLQASIVDAGGTIYRQVYGESFDAPLFVGPLLELGAQDHHDLVLTHRADHLLWASRPRSFRGRRAVRSLRLDGPSGAASHKDSAGYQRRSQVRKSRRFRPRARGLTPG